MTIFLARSFFGLIAVVMMLFLVLLGVQVATVQELTRLARKLTQQFKNIPLRAIAHSHSHSHRN